MLRKVIRPLLALPFVVWGYSVVHAQVSCILLGASSGTANQNASPNGQLTLINPATGTFTHICTLGFGLGAMAQHPITGVLYAVDAPGFSATLQPRRLIRLEPFNCSETTIGTNLGVGRFGIADLAFRNDGTLFAWSENSDDLITINTTTGVGTIVANAGISTFGSGLEFGPDGVTLYLAGNGGNGALRTVNTTTGITTVVVPAMTGSPAPGFPISALSFGNGQMYGAHKTRFPSSTLPSADNLVTINLTTGVITNMGPSVPKLDALAWYCSTAAPTFGTWQTLILTIVLVSAAYWQLRRRKHIIV